MERRQTKNCLRRLFPSENLNIESRAFLYIEDCGRGHVHAVHEVLASNRATTSTTVKREAMRKNTESTEGNCVIKAPQGSEGSIRRIDG